MKIVGVGFQPEGNPFGAPTAHLYTTAGSRQRPKSVYQIAVAHHRFANIVASILAYFYAQHWGQKPGDTTVRALRSSSTL